MVAVAREHLALVCSHAYVICTHACICTRAYVHIRMHVHTYTVIENENRLFENFLDCDSNDCHLFAHFLSPLSPPCLSHLFKRRLPQISILRCGRRDNGVCVKFGGRRVKWEDHYRDRENPGWVLHLKSSDPMFMERRDGDLPRQNLFLIELILLRIYIRSAWTR